MPWWFWLIVVVVVGGVLLAAGLVHRVQEVRRAGTPVLLRRLPAAQDQGWRHGSVHYTDEALVYYRLTALLPGPTETLSRRGTELFGRRAPAGTELEIMEPSMAVLELRVTERGRGVTEYEIGMDPVLATAFLSWLEARPPSRSRRRRSAP
ncbi:DUF2550 domain-containing protein [Gordonia sp. (in: high G+C Gram-positive bacteria)]|uniref:DUF2550 domain-containing protein n=1 Tax=Gordonia sp. (in: high G+C Gram-positive bacteria) TaxID=84139 RepID=UPI002621F13E|nr:DUF2550 domain-containing protein [Gordonia sp. (in: high G+C Gram-positive bacteria)]